MYRWTALHVHIDADAELEHGGGEDAVPFRDLPGMVPGKGDRPRAVKDGEQRYAAHRCEMGGDGPDEGLHPLVRDDGHLGIAGPFQAGGEEVDPLLGAVEEHDIDLPEVVLSELAGNPLEAHRVRNVTRAEALDELEEGALPAGIAQFPGPPEELECHEVRCGSQHVLDGFPERHGLDGAADPALLPLGSVVEVLDGWLMPYSPRRPQPDSCMFHNFLVSMACL